MSQAAQINTRISQDLKRKGEEAFAAAGLTSSEAIRMFYLFAADHKHQPELIAQRLECPDEASAKAAREKRERGLAAIGRGGLLCSEALETLGIDDPDETILNLPYDQLKQLAFDEKYGTGCQS